MGCTFSKLLSGIILLITMEACSPATQAPVPIAPVPLTSAPTSPKLTPADIKNRSTPLIKTLPAPAAEAPRLKTQVPDTARHPLKAQTISSGGITFTIVSFDSRDHELHVAEQASPGSKWSTAREASGSGLAAINAGFFTPEGKPLGLLFSNGSQKGSFNRASSLGSGFFIGGSARARIISRDSYRANPPKEKEILQSGPRLLWNGTILPGLSDGDSRPRSFLMWDGKNHFAMVHADSANLAGLARVLKNQPFGNFKIHHALNLDGGRSSDLWVSEGVKGGSLSRRSWINQPIQNYLVLHRKP